MSMNINGRMTNCPFMNDVSSFCQMGVFEHINKWQQFFTVIREKSLLLSLFALLTFFKITSFAVFKKLYEKLKHQRFRKYFYRYNPEMKVFNNLALAFSRGIIKPKIYV